MNSNLTFRAIAEPDIPSLFDIRIATWHNQNGREELAALGITQDSVAAMLGKSHQGRLCIAEGRPVGFAMGNRETGEMWVIAVLSEFEGRGIGRRLLSSVEEWLFGEGWDTIWLTTDPDESVRAVGFYRHLGWVDWKLIPGGDRYLRKSRKALNQSTPTNTL